MRYIIIPDLHGRDFWKQAIPLQNDETELVFLGDYFDPYPQEEITPQQAIQNFDEMFNTLDLEGCQFLIGNHDSHYLYNTLDKSTRYSIKYAEDIKNRLKKIDDLSIATWFTINHVSYLLTHAGINNNWLSRHTDLWSNDRIGLLDLNNPELIFAAAEIGKSRGGWYKTGGPLWADISDMDVPDIPYYQIFGHTRLKNAQITDKWACLDCKKLFIVDDTGLHGYTEDK